MAADALPRPAVRRTSSPAAAPPAALSAVTPPWAIDGSSAAAPAAGRVPGSRPDHRAANFLTGPKARPAHVPPSLLGSGGWQRWTSDAWGRLSDERRHFPGRASGGAPEFAVPAVSAADCGWGGPGTAATPYHLRRTAGGGSGGAAAAAGVGEATAPSMAVNTEPCSGGGGGSGDVAAGVAATAGLQRTGAWASGWGDQEQGRGAAAHGGTPAYRRTRRMVPEPRHTERAHSRRVPPASAAAGHSAPQHPGPKMAPEAAHARRRQVLLEPDIPRLGHNHMPPAPCGQQGVALEEWVGRKKKVALGANSGQGAAGDLSRSSRAPRVEDDASYYAAPQDPPAFRRFAADVARRAAAATAAAGKAAAALGAPAKARGRQAATVERIPLSRHPSD
ncbi:MAG: hypothetical protein J3K34DRAFT_290546 [Monoraphidium minutum]|nr:MAG: hypothetical protein J3K34DRAFT_290546 [Monoraphidium minutum]